MLKNDRFLRALQGQAVDRTPVWLMRQAGRYLPEYRAIRSQEKNFLTLCKNAPLACEITLQPIDRFDLDAAIIFSDILVVPEAMGLSLDFVAGEGPQFANPIRTMAQIQALSTVDPADSLAYVLDAIALTKKALADRVPLIGFCGSPWTVATYMVEGGSSKDFRFIKKMLYSAPEMLTALLDKLAEASIAYLCAQVAAGADVLMIFDTWGGALNDVTYPIFSLAYMEKIVVAVRKKAPTVPIILFTKRGSRWLESIAATGCQGIGIDESCSLQEAKARLHDTVALQGNLDPAVLYAPPAAIERAVQDVLASYGHGHRHIFNLGHGVLQETDPAHVQVLINAVRAFSPAYHQ